MLTNAASGGAWDSTDHALGLLRPAGSTDLKGPPGSAKEGAKTFTAFKKSGILKHMRWIACLLGLQPTCDHFVSTRSSLRVRP